MGLEAVQKLKIFTSAGTYLAVVVATTLSNLCSMPNFATGQSAARSIPSGTLLFF